jgi:hypothetical protein
MITGVRTHCTRSVTEAFHDHGVTLYLHCLAHVCIQHADLRCDLHNKGIQPAALQTVSYSSTQCKS